MTGLEVVEVEPGVAPRGGNAQLQRQLIPRDVNAHKGGNGDVHVDHGPWRLCSFADCTLEPKKWSNILFFIEKMHLLLRLRSLFYNV